MLALLADLTGATDPVLRALARSLAGRVFVDMARSGPVRRRGVGTIVEQPYRIDGGDIDLDASTDAIVAARAASSAIDPAELRMRSWATPATALCLLVDRSGSMSGAPLATAAIAAAVLAWRAPDDYSVISFAREALVVKSQDRHRGVEEVVDAVLALRGHGTTDLAGALLAAREQLLRSEARRRIVILLSDCRSNEPGDAREVAATLDELLVIAPDGDHEDAQAFAASVGARFTTVAGPAAVPDAIAAVLDR